MLSLQGQLAVVIRGNLYINNLGHNGAMSALGYPRCPKEVVSQACFAFEEVALKRGDHQH